MNFKEFKENSMNLSKLQRFWSELSNKYDKYLIEPFKKDYMQKKSSKNKEGLIIVRNKDMLHSLITDNTPLGLLDVSLISDFSNLFFYKQRKDYSGIENWDVSNATDMHCMFEGSDFNGNISSWNVSNVKNMSFMFANTDYFNNDISKWNVSNVTNMEQMFRGSDFNQNICNWNVCNCLNMTGMFFGSKFNQNLAKWSINDKCLIDRMFDFCAMEEKNLPQCIQAILSSWKDNYRFE